MKKIPTILLLSLVALTAISSAQEPSAVVEVKGLRISAKSRGAILTGTFIAKDERLREGLWFLNVEVELLRNGELLDDEPWPYWEIMDDGVAVFRYDHYIGEELSDASGLSARFSVGAAARAMPVEFRQADSGTVVQPVEE